MKTLALSLTLLMAFALSTALAAEDGKALYAAKCQSCHGADGAKTAMSKPLKGQSAGAIVKAMQGYKAKTFGGAKKATMENLASRMGEEQFTALGDYIGTL